MEQRYLIDTNVIIDNLGNKLPKKAKEFLIANEAIASVVSKIEVLGWPNASAEQLNPVYLLMEMVSILPIDEKVIERTIAIRQKKKISLGDANHCCNCTCS